MTFKRWIIDPPLLQTSVFPERKSESALATYATVGLDSGDVSLMIDVAGGDESWSIVAVLSQGSAGGGSVVANVPRRDGSVGPIQKAKGGRGFIEYNTVYKQTPINANVIVHFAVLLGMISFFIIGYAMGASPIHSTVANVLTLTAKRKRMLATNREGVETIRCTSCTLTCTNVLLCVLLFPHYICQQQLTPIFSF